MFIVIKGGSLEFQEEEAGLYLNEWLAVHLFEILVFEVNVLGIEALALQKEKATVRDYTTVTQLHLWQCSCKKKSYHGTSPIKV